MPCPYVVVQNDDSVRMGLVMDADDENTDFKVKSRIIARDINVTLLGT